MRHLVPSSRPLIFVAVEGLPDLVHVSRARRLGGFFPHESSRCPPSRLLSCCLELIADQVNLVHTLHMYHVLSVAG